MRRSRFYTFDHSASFLSVFDIGSALLPVDDALEPKGLDYDMSQLMKDQSVLTKDYEHACKRVAQELGNK